MSWPRPECQRFFVLTCRVPPDGFSGSQADKTASHPGRLWCAPQQGTVESHGGSVATGGDENSVISKGV